MGQQCPEMTNGPGKFTKAMGITTKLNGIELYDKNSAICLYDNSIIPDDVIESPRVGINYAEEYIEKPWRFRIKNNIWVGK
ncbi:MAG: DNA-3-methyladenine glycosylase [Saprospiraceae bacterium]